MRAREVSDNANPEWVLRAPATPAIPEMSSIWRSYRLQNLQNMT